MSQDNQRGSAVVGLLVVALLIAIGAAGYFAWQNQQRAKTSTEAKVTPTVTASPTPNTADDKLVTDALLAFCKEHSGPIEIAEVQFARTKAEGDFLEVNARCVVKPDEGSSGFAAWLKKSDGKMTVLLAGQEALTKTVAEKNGIPASFATIEE